MSVRNLSKQSRTADYFTHIDMGFLNRRLATTALGPLKADYFGKLSPGDDRLTKLGNDHLLVTMLIDICSELEAPTLADALKIAAPKHLFMSIERVEACPEIYEAERVSHNIHLDYDCDSPVMLSYHTEHIVSSTGRMTLACGFDDGYRQAIIGLLHKKSDRFEIEPIVIGAPWLDHPRNGEDSNLVWQGRDYGEVLPEDIDEFAGIMSVSAETADEWMSVMKDVPESHVKDALAALFNEPTKADWSGEENDHFSSNVTVGGKRRTAAFLLKGPSNFREMTPAMCGKNGDQIYRLNHARADISVVQHSHLIGPAVRETIRAFVCQPGPSRKFCIMDGQATYRLLKAIDRLP